MSTSTDNACKDSEPIPRCQSPLNVSPALLEAGIQTEPHDMKAQSISQFNMPVVISTFACSVIVSFLSLVRDVVGDTRTTLYYVGCLLSFLAMSVHLAVIIVAGRSAAIASSQWRPMSKTTYNDEYFQFCFALCDQLQFFATILFVLSASVLIFGFFERTLWPILILGWSFVLALVVFCAGYWRASMTHQNLCYVADIGKSWRSSFHEGATAMGNRWKNPLSIIRPAMEPRGSQE